MNTPIVEYEGDQLEIDFDVDRPEFSICPSCAAQVIKIADGCGVCGWSDGNSGNSPLSIPCIIKYPLQLEIKGIMVADLGTDAVVRVDGKDINVCKMWIHPILSEVNKCRTDDDKCSSKTTPPSKNCSSKTRRQKGEGSGAIFYRTVTSQGRDYQQAYYHWRDSNGKQRTKYIPVKLLDKVCQAEFRKQPVEDILLLLGCIEKCKSKSSDTNSKKCSSKNIHPSKKRREKGRGTGYIECKLITKNGKQYKQYWFHWQVWRDGETVTKKSRYIPKRLVPKVERMNNEKEPVEKILKVLQNRVKRKK